MRKRRYTILSGAAVGDDLVIEILLRLPLKSLVRFEAVSKHWFSFINGPNISHRRYPNPKSVTAPSALLLHLHPRSCLILGDPRDSIRKQNVGFIPLTMKTPPIETLSSFINTTSGVFIIQSCNGLLLCCSSFEGDGDMKYYIVNPTTKQFRTLPHPHGKCKSIALAFNPSSNPMQSHYIVVCVLSNSDPIFNYHYRYYQIEIYSSKTRTWRRSGKPFVAPFSIHDHHGVFWNGAVHWVTNEMNSFYFNLSQQSVQTIPMPRRGRIIIKYFGECRDHLQLILTEDLSSTKLDLFEMGRDYSAGWCVKHRVQVDRVAAAFTWRSQRSDFDFSVLFVGDDVQEQEESSFMMLHIAKHFFRYNLKDSTFHKVSGHAEGFQTGRYIGFGCFRAHHFSQTLYSV